MMIKWEQGLVESPIHFMSIWLRFGFIPWRLILGLPGRLKSFIRCIWIPPESNGVTRSPSLEWLSLLFSNLTRFLVSRANKLGIYAIHVAIVAFYFEVKNYIHYMGTPGKILPGFKTKTITTFIIFSCSIVFDGLCRSISSLK